jgi:hypothetical protein
MLDILKSFIGENEFSQNKLVILLLEIAGFCKEHFQHVKINKYIIWQPVNYNYYPNQNDEQIS